MSPLRVALVAGARPNFMKVAPLHAALAATPDFEPVLVHAGQHFDHELSGAFLEQLGLPAPVVNFGVGSGSHAFQTGRTMMAFEAWLESDPVGLVVVVGDVNATLAAALVAAKGGVPLAHVEAGLRSRDRSMPEEVNRVVVDGLADLLFCTEPAAVANLRAEGIPDERIHLVGNVMIDSLIRHLKAAAASDVHQRLGIEHGPHVLATLHRPSNVDRRERLEPLLRALLVIGRDAPVVLPLHPRTAARVEAFGIGHLLRQPGLVAAPPLPYLDFLHLMATARAVVTDSGGVQEETTVLGVDCLTVRDNTERPITIERGTNRLVGTDPTALVAAWQDLVARGPRRLPPPPPPLWDGRAAERIVVVLGEWAQSGGGRTT